MGESSFEFLLVISRLFDCVVAAPNQNMVAPNWVVSFFGHGKCMRDFVVRLVEAPSAKRDGMEQPWVSTNEHDAIAQQLCLVINPRPGTTTRAWAEPASC